MKSFLVILSLCISLQSSKLFAEEEDTLRNNRKINLSLDNLNIYDNEGNRKKDILEDLALYDNQDLRGTPSFISNKEKIIDQRGNEKKEYFYKDHYKYSGYTTAKDLPMEFIGVSYTGLYIGISEYKNGIVTVLDKNKKYFFKLSDKYFRYIDWKEERHRETVLKHLQYLEDNDKEFQAIINPIRKCIKEKNLECFKKSIDPQNDLQRESQIDYDSIQWSISLDDKLCKIVQLREWPYTIDGEDVLAKELKTKIIPWEIYEEGFSFKDPKTSFRHVTEYFGKSEQIYINLEGRQACEVKENFSLHLTRKPNNKWEMFFERGIGPAAEGC